MKRPSTSLLELVSSLSKTEKRYFILSAKGDSHIYSNLFHAINRGSVYDESKIRKKIGVDNPNTFKKLKNYTFNRVLKSLEAYYSENSAEFKAMRKLMQADILIDKKLYLDARKLLKSVLHLAHKKDMLFFLLPCYERLYKTGVNAGQPGLSLKEIDPAKVDKAARDCGRLLRLKHMNSQFWNFVHTSSDVATPAEIRLLNQIAQTTLGILKEEKAGFSVSREAFLLLGLSYRFAGKPDQSYIYRKKSVELLEAESEFLAERRHEYIVALGNLLNICRDSRRTEEVTRCYEKAESFIRRIPLRLKDFRLDESYCNLKNSYVTFLFSENRFEEVVARGEELLKELRRHGDRFENSLLTILYRNLMVANFQRKDLRTSLRYFHLLMKRYPKDDAMNRVFGLIIHYESGDADALHYQCRSMLYFLDKSGKYPAVREFTRLLDAAMLSRIDRIHERRSFSELNAWMKKHEKTFGELRSVNKFDFIAWSREKAGA